MRREWFCTSCETDQDVEPQYSFGIYAGRLCPKCCLKYRDHCGIDQEQGDAYNDLDEQIDDDY